MELQWQVIPQIACLSQQNLMKELEENIYKPVHELSQSIYIFQDHKFLW